MKNLTEVLEAEYRQLVEQVPAITYIAERGANGVWYYVSPQVETILGFTPAEWTSDAHRWRKQLHPDDLPIALAAERTLSREGDRYRAEYRLSRSDGSYVWVRDEAIYVRHHDNGKLVMRGLLLDISERKEAEEELRRSEQRLLATINAAPVILFAIDPAGIFTFSAGKALEGLRLKSGQVVGQSVFDLYSDQPQILDHLRRALAGEEFTAIDNLSGVSRTFETRWAPGRDKAGRPFGVIGVATDITEHVQLQEQLRTMQQLEAIGRLAGGVAHDFNNLINIVLGYAQLLNSEPNLTERIRNGLAQICRAGERAASLTNQLLAFSRKQVLQPCILNLNSIVSDIEKMLSRVIGEDIELVTKLDSSLLPITADPVQVEQVLMNLAVNARDAMPHGGRLLMETANVELDESDPRRPGGSPVGPYVRMTVSDSGHGMNAETLQRVFEPFFTTKDPGKGTGLGLATVYGIIRQSGGNILVESELGKGTSFQIYFPATAADAELRREAPEAEVSGGTETLLIVEDEPNLREIARIFLEDYGYQVLEAVDVEAALRIATKFPDTIHLLLTDVIMPRKSGRQLAEQVREMRPGIKVLFMSGYTDDMIVRHDVLAPGVALLQKPFNRTQLAKMIRTVLDKD